MTPHTVPVGDIGDAQAVAEQDHWENDPVARAAYEEFWARDADEQAEAEWDTLFADRYPDWKDDMLADDHQADITPEAFRDAMIDEAVDAAERRADG